MNHLQLSVQRVKKENYLMYIISYFYSYRRPQVDINSQLNAKLMHTFPDKMAHFYLTVRVKFFS